MNVAINRYPDGTINVVAVRGTSTWQGAVHVGPPLMPVVMVIEAQWEREPELVQGPEGWTPSGAHVKWHTVERVYGGGA